ncbi:hypothetical protein UlMin_015157 [Ulmus minor]
MRVNQIMRIYIRPPNMNNVHHTIRYNNRFFPYFQGDTTWNVLAACDFDLKFTYMLSGWEGSAHDARVLEHAISEPLNSFPFPPPGKYYLVDSGYANRGFFFGSIPGNKLSHPRS